MRKSFLVGTAGWDYPDWNGVVYPSGARIDRLTLLAGFVDVVEINSSFYRPVAPSVSKSWLRRAPETLTFTAKAHRSWTHDAGVDPDRAVPETLSGLAPLHDAGRLGALLVQFPQSFHFEPAATDRLDALLERTGDWPVVLEVRHVSWESDEAEQWVRHRGVGWCAVDQPRIGRSTARVLPRVVGPVAYLRLHGRNTDNWFRENAGRDARYDYLYGESELEELAGTAREMGRVAEQTFVIQNNHFRGQALVNALQMKALLTGQTPEAPETLVAAYPELEPHVSFKRTRLF